MKIANNKTIKSDETVYARFTNVLNESPETLIKIIGSVASSKIQFVLPGNAILWNTVNKLLKSILPQIKTINKKQPMPITE